MDDIQTIIAKEVIKTGMPESLIKATYDPFHYALKTIDGEIIEFERAELINENFIKIFPLEGYMNKQNHWENDNIPLAPRGLEINIRKIIWACDAPDGS